MNMENKVKNIIQEAVSEALDEISISQKKRNNNDVERFFRKGKGGFNGIRTIVVLTAENPDSVKASNKYNKKAKHSLLKDIKNGGYTYVPAMGKFGGNTEKPYAIFNMSVDTAKIISGQYQQTSFVFTELLEDSSIHSEYWEKLDINAPYDKKNNDCVKKDECNEWIDMANADDNFTIVGNKFKYSIPFPIFENVNRILSNNIQRILDEEKNRGNKTINTKDVLDFSINRVGMSPYLWRKAITRGFYNN